MSEQPSNQVGWENPTNSAQSNIEKVGFSHPTNLPKEWKSVPLGEIANWGSGGTPSRKNTEYYDGDIPWIKTGDLGNKVVSQASEFITEEAVKNSSAKYFPKGSVIIAMYGATIGKTSILGIDATTNQACGVGQPIEGLTTTDYLYYLLCNEKDNFIAKGKGGAQPNISQTIIKSHTISFPPLAEQKEIATQLDNLLAQVDTLKNRLDAIPTLLKRFRQSVLAAAVSGKLTKAFEKPQITSLKKLGKLVGGKTPSKSNLAFWDDGFIPWVSPKDMKVDVITDSQDHITQLALDKGGMKLVSKNSVIMVTRSGILSHSFPVAMTACDITINQDIKAFTPDPKEIEFHFIWIVLKAYEYKILSTCSKTGTTVASIETQLLENFEFLLPTKEEQTEIVTQVETLFAFADKIENRLKQAQTQANNLTPSLLAKALRGDLTAEWRQQNPDLITGKNSAKALLERIKADQEKLKPKRKTRKKKT